MLPLVRPPQRRHRNDISELTNGSAKFDAFSRREKKCKNKKRLMSSWAVGHSQNILARKQMCTVRNTRAMNKPEKLSPCNAGERGRDQVTFFHMVALHQINTNRYLLNKIPTSPSMKDPLSPPSDRYHNEKGLLLPMSKPIHSNPIHSNLL